MPKRTPKNQYVVNPYTGRNVKVGSRIHQNLVNSGAFKKQNNYSDSDSISSSDNSFSSDDEKSEEYNTPNNQRIMNPKQDLTQEEQELIIELANQLK